MPPNIERLKPTGKFAVSFEVETKSIKEEENKEGKFGIFQGYASTFGNVDHHDDIVARGAFKATIANRNKVKMLLQHDMYDLIGSFTDFKEDSYGLMVEGRVNLGTKSGQDAFALVKAGDLDMMSIGYRVLDFDMDRDTGIRILKELELMEISLVTFPANDMAQVTAVKSFVANELLPIATEEDLKHEIDDTKNVKINDLYLYQNDNEFKLNIGGYINGSVKAIPELIKKASKEVKDLDITDQEKALIRQTLTKYYKEMGEDSPWEAKSLDKAETITDIEAYLKDMDMSNKEAKKLISKIKEFSRDRDDVEEKTEPKERDAAGCTDILKELKNLTNFIKGG